MSSTNATVHLEAASEEPPKFHCVYDGFPGEFSIRVAGQNTVTVYIAGTFAELRDWATQFIAACIDGRAAVMDQQSASGPTVDIDGTPIIKEG